MSTAASATVVKSSSALVGKHAQPVVRKVAKLEEAVDLEKGKQYFIVDTSLANTDVEDETFLGDNADYFPQTNGKKISLEKDSYVQSWENMDENCQMYTRFTMTLDRTIVWNGETTYDFVNGVTNRNDAELGVGFGPDEAVGSLEVSISNRTVYPRFRFFKC